LQQVGFTEGQEVKKGDFLAQIDPRPYQAALAQAQGTLLHDQALLAAARVDLKRYQTLNKQDSIARQQVDTQAALVQQYEGTVQSDQAAVDTQKLNLTYCHITAPVDGRVGLRLVDPGNYVATTSSTGLLVITQLKPITVIFNLPEDDIPEIMKRLAAGATLPVTAYTRADTSEIATGTLSVVDNQIDTTTGTVKLRATFPNTDEALFPNQFVNAALLVDTLHDAVTVPTPAIQRGAPGTFVYVVNADNTVSVKPVKLGPAANDVTSITSGLAVGDKVVIDGADRLRDGSKVMVPDATPAAPTAEAPRRRRPEGK
jgi:multidrug efflux system membrane fusion protein